VRDRGWRWRRSARRRTAFELSAFVAKKTVTDGPGDCRRADSRLDDLRQQLRSLGYLDAGRRFLLAPRSRAASGSPRVRRPGRPAGGICSVPRPHGLGARLPGPISGPRDALVLAVYLGISLPRPRRDRLRRDAGATTIVSARDERFANQARTVSRAAGWLIAAAASSTCVLVAQCQRRLRWSAPVWTALLRSRLLPPARHSHITTLAVLAAGGCSGALPPVRPASWRVVIGGGAGAGAAVLPAGAPAADSPVADHPPLTVVSRRPDRPRRD
jgi:hypothetical protein